jgi:two-component system, NarL family, response regulator DevR
MIRIAIIDDHELVREGLKVMLAREPDFEVVGESADADRILKLVETSHPDVVLLDARLPGIAGPTACRLLTESHPEVRVLIVSTYADADLVQECIMAGAKGYVLKDIERFDLKESIRAVHRGEGFVSPTIAATVLDIMRTHRETTTSKRPELNESQWAILRFISEGYSNREIAERVHLSENTVKSHIQEIFRKLDVRNRVEAALRATKEGWIDGSP